MTSYCYIYYPTLSRLQACNKSHTVSSSCVIYSYGCVALRQDLVKDRCDIKHIIA